MPAFAKHSLCCEPSSGSGKEGVRHLRVQPSPIWLWCLPDPQGTMPCGGDEPQASRLPCGRSLPSPAPSLPSLAPSGCCQRGFAHSMQGGTRCRRLLPVRLELPHSPDACELAATGRHGGGCRPCPRCCRPVELGGMPAVGIQQIQRLISWQRSFRSNRRAGAGAGGLRPGRRKSGRPRQTLQVRVALARRGVRGRMLDGSCRHPLAGQHGATCGHWAGWQLAGSGERHVRGLLAPSHHSGSGGWVVGPAGALAGVPQPCPWPGQWSSHWAARASSQAVLPSSFLPLCQGQITHCTDWWCLALVGSRPAAPRQGTPPPGTSAPIAWRVPAHGSSPPGARQGTSLQGCSLACLGFLVARESQSECLQLASALVVPVFTASLV